MSWLSRQETPQLGSSPVIPTVPDGVLQVCHPHWRGVRASALAFRDPVLESADLSDFIPYAAEIAAAGAHTVVVQGWPPNAELFARAAHDSGLTVLAVFHSSPAQHGVDGGEAEAVHRMIELNNEGVIARVATVKSGLSGAFAALGHDIVHISNRVPEIGTIDAGPSSNGTRVGIFLHPMWRKNVTTQILAAKELGWKPFVMADPNVSYLSNTDFTVVGELSREEFLPIQAGMDITLNVTLSECHPMMPMESYRLGVPCLMSRTSDLFLEHPDLYRLTTVDQADNPTAIAGAAKSLLSNKDEAVEMANEALDRMDERSTEAWRAFTQP